MVSHASPLSPTQAQTSSVSPAVSHTGKQALKNGSVWHNRCLKGTTTQEYGAMHDESYTIQERLVFFLSVCFVNKNICIKIKCQWRNSSYLILYVDFIFKTLIFVRMTDLGSLPLNYAIIFSFITVDSDIWWGHEFFWKDITKNSNNWNHLILFW